MCSSVIRKNLLSLTVSLSFHALVVMAVFFFVKSNPEVPLKTTSSLTFFEVNTTYQDAPVRAPFKKTTIKSFKKNKSKPTHRLSEKALKVQEQKPLAVSSATKDAKDQSMASKPFSSRPLSLSGARTLLKKYVAPAYPRRALMRKQQGRVILKISVKNGLVAAVDLFQKSPYPLLDQAALKAARGWEFQNHLSMNYLQAVSFRLR